MHDAMSIQLWWLPAYLAIGAMIYLLDLKFGMPIYQGAYGMLRRGGEAERRGFIIGRSRRTQLLWGMAVSYSITVFLLVKGNPLWYFEMAFASVEGLVCFIGMQLGPVANAGLTLLGVTLDTFDRLEKKMKTEGPAMVDSAAQSARELKETVADKVDDLIGGSDDQGPRLTPEQERQAKIDKMDELLGKKQGRG